MKDPLHFEVAWTRPGGEEVARWDFLQGGPAPEGFRRPHPTEQLIETWYAEGKLVLETEIGPPIFPPAG